MSELICIAYDEFKADRAAEHPTTRAEHATEYAAVCFDAARLSIAEAEAAAVEAVEAQLAAEEAVTETGA